MNIGHPLRSFECTLATPIGYWSLVPLTADGQSDNGLFGDVFELIGTVFECIASDVIVHGTFWTQSTMKNGVCGEIREVSIDQRRKGTGQRSKGTENISKGTNQRSKGQIREAKGQIREVKGQIRNVKAQIKEIKGQIRGVP